MAVLERLSRVGDIDPMETRMRRMLSDLSWPFTTPVTPAADVYESSTELVVELEVPGYSEQELDLELTDHMLVVKGKREEETEATEKTLRLHERLESTFERRFHLPVETDSEHLSASYAKGVLTIRIPKTVSSTPRKIEIARQQ
jgi:HSP20 family protein